VNSEVVVLVDDAGRPTGTAPKATSHGADCPRHLGFSCYVFNPDGLFLATQRAKSKLTWPGWWTNSCCGHPGPDESGEAAVQRRLRYELGIEASEIRLVLPDFSYTATWGGASENELCPVFLAVTQDDPQPNPDEVEAFRWMPFDDFVADIDEITPWAREQLPLLARHVTEFLATKSSD
jgi:isopentenyl-diphosphate delta-isomerase